LIVIAGQKPATAHQRLLAQALSDRRLESFFPADEATALKRWT
jgi:hypothetical protein